MVFLALVVKSPGGGVTTRTVPITRTAPVLIGFCTRFTVTVPGWLVSPGAGGPTVDTVYWKVSGPVMPGVGV